MKKLEYILNAIYYGFYLFMKKIDIFSGRTGHHFITKGLGYFFGGSISFYLLSSIIIINKFIDNNIMPF